MKIRKNIVLGEKGKGLPGRCLRVGKVITTLQCGFAYAGNSIMKGDGSGILMGIGTVSEVIKDAESLMSGNKALIRSIRDGVLELAKELKPGTKVSKKAAAGILIKVRKLSQDANRLYSESAKDCV